MLSYLGLRLRILTLQPHSPSAREASTQEGGQGFATTSKNKSKSKSKSRGRKRKQRKKQQQLLQGTSADDDMEKLHKQAKEIINGLNNLNGGIDSGDYLTSELEWIADHSSDQHRADPSICPSCNHRAEDSQEEDEALDALVDKYRGQCRVHEANY